MTDKAADCDSLVGGCTHPRAFQVSPASQASPPASRWEAQAKPKSGRVEGSCAVFFLDFKIALGFPHGDEHKGCPELDAVCSLKPNPSVSVLKGYLASCHFSDFLDSMLISSSSFSKLKRTPKKKL